MPSSYLCSTYQNIYKRFKNRKVTFSSIVRIKTKTEKMSKNNCWSLHVAIENFNGVQMHGLWRKHILWKFTWKKTQKVLLTKTQHILGLLERLQLKMKLQNTTEFRFNLIPLKSIYNKRNTYYHKKTSIRTINCHSHNLCVKKHQHTVNFPVKFCNCLVLKIPTHCQFSCEILQLLGVECFVFFILNLATNHSNSKPS